MHLIKDGLRKCVKCKVVFPLTSEFFHRSVNNPAGLAYECKPCKISRDKGNRVRFAERNRDYRFEKSYGLSTAERDNMIVLQKGMCLICRSPLVDPVIDHDHTSGEVRGILCRKHNSMIGLAGDDVEILRRAVSYLQGSATSVDLEYF